MKKTDIYSIVTDRMISHLENGIVPWQRPWSGVLDGAISHQSGRPYSLLNQMLLGKEGEWVTEKEIEREGGSILDGEKPSIVVFWKYLKYETEEVDENGDAMIKQVPFLRYTKVWHIDQTDGLKKRFDFGELPPAPDPIDAAEEVVGLYLEREKHLSIHRDKASNRAFYAPLLDSITVPLLEQFGSVEEFYSTLFHEMTHSTGHRDRLARKEVCERTMFGDSDYSKEELVAEMGAAYLAATCGVDTSKTIKNSAAYINSWLGRLKNDKKLVVFAAAKAEAAAKYILGETD